MNNNQQFDNNIKEQFEDFTPQVHPRIWDNIIAKREKRKPIGFWFTFLNSRNILLLTALLIATGSGAYLLLKKSKENKENVIAKNEKQTASTVTTVNEITTIPQKNDTGNPQLINSNSNQNTSFLAISNANDVANYNSNQFLITAATSSKIKTYSPFAQTADDGIAVMFNDKNTAVVNNDYDITDADLNNGNPTVENNFLKRLLFPDLQKTMAEKKSVSLNKRYLPNVFLPDCPSVEKNAAGNKTYFEIYAGPDFAFRNLSDTGNSAYLQKRKESTKFSSAYSAGVRYTKVFNNGMSIRTGINYSQINEKFTFVQGNLIQITYIIDVNGDTTGSYITTGTRYKTTINRFRTIDVPVLVGYEMGNGKFHTNINAGVIVNVYSWQKGDVLDASYKPVSITTGKTNSPYQFKTNIGMAFMAGASVYYKLNDKIHVLAEPYFRYSLAPMSKENLTLKQKYNTAGLRLGLRVDLQ